MQIVSRYWPLVPLADVPARYVVAKRALDLTLGLLLAILLCPVFVACAVALWLAGSSPVLIREQRAGQGGRPFTFLRFGGQQPEQDQGVSRVQRVLADTRLDELPQLLNVLAGDMSLVGPRPPTSDDLDQLPRVHLQRLAVKPGLTGLWQVSGRPVERFDEMVKVDLDYAARASVSLDLAILGRTPVALLRRLRAGHVDTDHRGPLPGAGGKVEDDERMADVHHE